ncbi:MAG: hypothetical protein CMH54_13920 [Myxococcales bacterium]|nr:hypothetical protein [Myxococcales bacterium]
MLSNMRALSLGVLVLFGSIACGGSSDTTEVDAGTQEDSSAIDTGSSSDTGASTDEGTSTDVGSSTDTGSPSDCPADTFLNVEEFDGPGGNYPSPSLYAYCDGDTMFVESNGIPHYTFEPMTPNELQENNTVYSIPLNPQEAATPSIIPCLGSVGVAVNGAPFYGPNEAAFPDPYGDPVYNNLMDVCEGHTGGQGDYHYHALLVECLTADHPNDESTPSPIVGWALDGYPVYGPYGCLDTDCETIVEFKSSWDQIADPTEYAWQAHEYQAKDGAEYLDECNGRVGPDGTYRYHATGTFPYILGCFHGVVEGNHEACPEEGADNQNGGGNPGGPPGCTTDSDCPAGPNALGMTCTPDGICAPNCDSNADCPGGPAGMSLICNDEGYCTP